MKNIAGGGNVPHPRCHLYFMTFGHEACLQQLIFNTCVLYHLLGL